ncbi:GNAT family N-acetyltransferase [Actinoplanes sp. ATCC 53533]|nr:GNAT family N-acetyltransferase [Actinoplanes sp. ATCC 53533]
MIGRVTVIRSREPADLPACVTTLRAVHERDGYPLNWPADPVAWLTPPGTRRAWVAVDGETVAGHAIVTGEGEVSRLFVSPGRRGAGLAGELIDRARSAHGGELVLEVANDAAAAYYERTGWIFVAAGPAGWTAPDGSPVTLRRYRSS